MISKIEEIDIIVAKYLTSLSMLDTNRIINGNSIHGPELSKIVQDNISLSYDLTDSVIIFTTAIENNNVDYTEYDNSKTVRNQFSAVVNLTIYGNTSRLIAECLKARFETEKIRYNLLQEGLKFKIADEITSIDDIMNDTVWPRTDMKLHFVTEMLFDIDEFDEMTTIGDVKVTTAD